MATATQKERAARQVARRAKAAAVLTFVVFEDNGGDYRWTILDGAGERLAQSRTFASYDDAREAAAVVRDRARGARFGRSPGAQAGRVLDDADDANWVDDDGLGSEVVGQ